MSGCCPLIQRYTRSEFCYKHAIQFFCLEVHDGMYSEKQFENAYRRAVLGAFGESCGTSAVMFLIDWLKRFTYNSS